MRCAAIGILLIVCLGCTGCAEIIGLLLDINQQRMNQQYVNSAVKYNNAAANYLNRK